MEHPQSATPRRKASLSRRLRKELTRLRTEQSGVSLIEFALSMPILLSLGMYGSELAYLATVHMELSQMALSVADNASRLGQTDNSGVTPTVTESDIDSVLSGAVRQGTGIDFENNGRIILSSLERDAFTTKQYIHWQRCTGSLDQASAYGNDSTNNGLNGPVLNGMGEPGRKVNAIQDSAVMYAEIYYTYNGIFGTLFMQNPTIRQEAAFLIRDDRNLVPGVTGSGSQSNCT